MAGRKSQARRAANSAKPAKKERAIRHGNAMLLLAVIAIIILVFFFSYRAYSNFREFRSHYHYLREPGAQNQPWMTLHSVVDYFNVSEKNIMSSFGVNVTESTQRMTLSTICRTNRINCTQAIGSLNAQVQK